MNRILVIGKSGQLARSLQVSSSGNPSLVFTSKEELDISDKESVRARFLSLKPDVVINCAGYTNVELAEEQVEEAEKVNFVGIKNIVDTCNLFKTKLYHISTDYVFNGEKTKPYIETDDCCPLNMYGKTKAKGDEYVLQNCENYIIIRTAWLYSPFGNNFLKTVLRKLESEGELNVVADQIGSPTSAVSLAEFILWLTEKGNLNNKLINFTDVGCGSWFDMAQLIGEQLTQYTKETYKVNKIETSTLLLKANRPFYSVLSTDYLDSINYTQRYTWQETLQQHVKDILNSRNKNDYSSTSA